MKALGSFFKPSSVDMRGASSCALLSLLLALSACGPGTPDDPDSPDNGSGGSTSDGGDGDTGSGGSIVPQDPSACDESTPGARLVRRLTRRELTNTQQDIFGTAATSAPTALPGDAVDRIRLSNDSSILQMTQDTTQAVLDRAEEIATAVTAADTLPNLLPCASSSQDATCASEFVKKYGEALFRRTLEQADLDRYLALFEDVSGASDFNTGLKWTLVGLIQSPHAVYRTELGQGGALTPYEIASELSYDYSASPPSAELIAKALSGELDDPEARYEEAKKLLATERGADVVHQFFEEWLNYRDILTVSRAKTPDNFEAVRPKMALETKRFLETLLFEKNGNISDLLTANYTIADQELASYYGFSGGSADITQDGGTEVERTYGLGLFAQGSVTGTMSSITITSPTRRGLLLLRRLFCEVPGLPEAINFDLTVSELEGNTTRERLEASHLSTSCARCHERFDPLGFGFEHFDHVGRYREEEVTDKGSFPINATATVALLDDLPIDGQEQLMTGLSTAPAVLSCVSGTLSNYVYGGQANCRDKDARVRIMSGETSIVDYLAELAREPHFVGRN